MRSQIRSSLRILTAGFITLFTVMPLGAQSNSHARIVRLSFVEGNVTVERPDVQAWAEAPANTPLEEGFKLSTGENSFAEIQFENGGAIRLGQFALIDFTELELAPDGGKINHVDLRQGYATFHPLPSRLEESLQVGTPYGTLVAQGGTEFRVDLDQGLERVEVLSGSVKVQSSLGAMTLAKDSVLVMQPGTSDPAVVSQGITKDDWDQWVQDRENRMTMGPASASPESYTDDAAEATYGWADLLQYGSWSNVPGVGYGWIPNVIGAGWAPYSMGQWCWYPGWGYTWIGAEPWGWLPYHYGAWRFIPGQGWIWLPGSHRKWSPSQVTWFHGPGWVGWIPRQRGRDSVINCGTNCGGGVVSTSTFRQGGLLTSHHMLGINPTTGEMVKEPGIIPSMAAKLPGRAVSLPAAQSQSFQGRPAHAPVGASVPTTATSTPGSRNASAAPPNSTIVYDPQEKSYINGNHRETPQESPASRTGASAIPTPVSNPAVIQPVPAGGRGPSGQAAEHQGGIQPNPAGNSFTWQGTSAPNSNLSSGHVGGSRAGETQVYNPQEESYINGHHRETPQESPASRTGASVLPTPASNPAVIQPVPVGSRGPSGQAAEHQGGIQPNPAGNSFTRQGTSAPNSNPPAGRVGGGQTGETHAVGGTAAGGHSSSAPAGGGHAGGGTAGGGHH